MQEKISKILQIEPEYDKSKRKRDESYNPFGRTESLSASFAFRVSPQFKKHLMSLPNWAEIVRVVLEDELESGRFLERQPKAPKRGRGGDLLGRTGAGEQIVIRVSSGFREQITSINKWQAKAREALDDALDAWIVSEEGRGQEADGRWR